jgi:C-terminal processing protease CtpA/Prc
MSAATFFFQVNIKSLGEAAGLKAGDVILHVNGEDISPLKHKEAQEAIKRAGNNFVVAIQRFVTHF